MIKTFDLDIIETDLSDSALTDQQIVVEVLVCLVELYNKSLNSGIAAFSCDTGICVFQRFGIPQNNTPDVYALLEMHIDGKPETPF